jgi:hypothetical protein
MKDGNLSDQVSQLGCNKLTVLRFKLAFRKMRGPGIVDILHELQHLCHFDGFTRFDFFFFSGFRKGWHVEQ